MQQLVCLLDKINAITVDDALLNAFGPKQSDRRVIGVLSDNLKRFCTVYLGMCNELVDLHATFQARLAELGTPHEGNEDERQDIYYRHVLAHKLFEGAEAFFWAEVLAEFPEASREEAIAIRSGWTLVTTEHVCGCRTCSVQLMYAPRGNDLAFDLFGVRP